MSVKRTFKITKNFVGVKLFVHNGLTKVEFIPTIQIIGRKVGEFIKTRKLI